MNKLREDEKQRAIQIVTALHEAYPTDVPAAVNILMLAIQSICVMSAEDKDDALGRLGYVFAKANAGIEEGYDEFIKMLRRPN